MTGKQWPSFEVQWRWLFGKMWTFIRVPVYGICTKLVLYFLLNCPSLLSTILKILFYCSIVDLQYCVNFCCTAKWVSFTYIYILFHILFHYGLLQDIGYSSLCCAVGPCCLSILYILLCICQSQAPNPSLPTSLPLVNHKTVLYVCESVSVS